MEGSEEVPSAPPSLPIVMTAAARPRSAVSSTCCVALMSAWRPSEPMGVIGTEALAFA